MDVNNNNLVTILVLCINTIATISYYVIYSRENIKNAFIKLPQIIQKMYVGLFVIPLFCAPFFKQSKFCKQNIILMYSGIIVFIVGIAFIIMSFTKIGVVPSIKGKSGLSTNGIYGIVRHPIYAGTIIAQIGLTVLNQSLVTLIYIPISIILYFFMTVIEEKDLCNKFGKEYIEYKQKVKKRIIPFIL